MESTSPKKRFRSFFKDLYMQLIHTVVTQPQMNGKPKVTNQIILKGLKRCLKRDWGEGGDRLKSFSMYYNIPRSGVRTFNTTSNKDKKGAQYNKLLPFGEGPSVVVAMFE
ncbi:hypothetical protein IEQ34_005679 [Dendrobium chrysotoxum]|uniref:Uncharacterized protein n=1 Tax=Dendrobium chrysotoxum TaxID=161865 RepID=A0AAV7HAH4_DENCH|nr:hypothetical protein IEQ34_005679 [Dendrobium chrysotoxum]